MLSSVLPLVTSISFALTPLICEKGTIRETTDGKSTEIQATYCYNEDRNILTSPSCKNLNCPIGFDSQKKIDRKQVMNQTSNPGFNICRELDGRPQIVEFKVGKDWHRLDRCTFKDGSFVSTSELVGFYLRTRRD